jgi:hypothetical protein
MTFRDGFFKNRVKPIVISQIILTIPIIIFLCLSFTSYPVNYFYSGIAQSIFAVHWGLMGIEQIILRKKGWSIAFFVLTILFIYVAVETFNVSQLHK